MTAKCPRSTRTAIAAVSRQLPPRSARRNAVSLQSGFSETLSNGGGGGGRRIKPNPHHRLSIKPSEFMASPSDTVNTRSERPIGS